METNTSSAVIMTQFLYQLDHWKKRVIFSIASGEAANRHQKTVEITLEKSVLGSTDGNASRNLHAGSRLEVNPTFWWGLDRLYAQ